MRKRITNLVSTAALPAVIVLGLCIAIQAGKTYPAEGIVVAQGEGTDAPPPRGNRHHGPPPEAINACEGHGEGDACSFTSRRGDEIEGSCGTTRAGDFACIPEGGPPGKGGRMPDDAPPPPSDGSE